MKLQAANRILAGKYDDVDDYLMELDVEFFHEGNKIIVVLDSDSQATEIVNTLKAPFKLRVDSPSVLRQKSFAVVGDITVQKVGKSLRIYEG